MKIRVVIPVRLQSSRLPNKPLLEIAGKTMLQRVYERACQANADSILIATDSYDIMKHARSINAPVCLTSTQHQSGTERIAEVISLKNYDKDDIIVNVQGDEPLIPPKLIDQVADDLIRHPEAVTATLCEPVDSVTVLHDPNVVKVVVDHQGYALYFSRSPIPWLRDQRDGSQNEWLSCACRHIGLYAYRAGFLKIYAALPNIALGKITALEQLRILYYGHKIHVAQAKEAPGIGVDTAEDLRKVRDSFL
ncbi:MAG: 3-deoxy-manno-octulosonate cytidylyltransferase [Pseudomonadota bacterium]